MSLKTNTQVKAPKKPDAERAESAETKKPRVLFISYAVASRSPRLFFLLFRIIANGRRNGS